MRPTGTRSVPGCPPPPDRVAAAGGARGAETGGARGAASPRPGRGPGTPSTSSSGGGAPSGGSHTRWAGGPSPTSAAIVVSSTVGPSAASSPSSAAAGGGHGATGPTGNGYTRRAAVPPSRPVRPAAAGPET